MKRGRLRVLLGAAPGVGKTYEMLEEGRRLRDAGVDVVVAVVETHGRAATAAQIADLPVVPRRRIAHRGVSLDEMDLAAVIDRGPRLALVDELAHTNAPGSPHAKRWQDVEALRDAGIDVITTVNVQHIESLGGVVEQITGIAQRETVPDAVVRSAKDVEVVDLAPASLRDRLAAGLVYPAERIDAALSNYFRLGNLTALRELALLWLADEVDNALKTYRAEHGIEGIWQARERVVVALTGGPEGETLLRRGARIAARAAGGELLAVHVSGQDGLRSGSPAALAEQQALVGALGGTYHQVVGDDVPRALVEFARSVDATQLVVGVSRRARLAAALSGPGIGATVIRESGDIDVHMVTHAAAGGRFALPRIAGGALSAQRRVLGFALALGLGPLLTWLLVALRSPESITSDVLAYQLLVVVVALVGGLWPAVFAAVMSGVTLDFFFVAPLYTVEVSDPLHAWALALYVVIALLVSVIVDRAARGSRAARRAAAESDLLAAVAGSVLRGDGAVPALVARAREAFGLSGARLVAGDGTVLASDGEPVRDGRHRAVAVGERAVLELHGVDPERAEVSGSERRLLDVVVTQLAGALEQADLQRSAREAAVLAETDRVRSALLSAVSHDVRRPLAAAMAAIGGLRAAGPALSDSDRDELLDTANDSLTTLTALVTDLLDVSRIEAGALAVAVQPVDASGVILSAMEELHLGPGAVDLALEGDPIEVAADAVLLQRVLVNLLANAHRHAPTGASVRVTTSTLGARAQIRVIDRGPGIPPERHDDVFAPFQRLGDADNTTGLGLGLALSRGFAEGMRGSLTPERTPGGGLTMVVELALADPERARHERIDG
ncbi:sensor histidine kinase [Microbacterium radiodurans]|uniref:histidine kinase n=1 Tax=Microbacterium radiodurans TaxID=661398 RepID=A0A5J5ITB0_9MICO|nr:ATP-binding protein [Microbacterium radiodurans]KAA9089344.1 sensor histidine kinase KdpD [Microbacterium radiodurans]